MGLFLQLLYEDISIRVEEPILICNYALFWPNSFFIWSVINSGKQAKEIGK